MTDIRHMKWWGWGYEDVTFDDSNKPALWPYLARELEGGDIEWTRPVTYEAVNLPAQNNHEGFFKSVHFVFQTAVLWVYRVWFGLV